MPLLTASSLAAQPGASLLTTLPGASAAGGVVNLLSNDLSAGSLTGYTTSLATITAQAVNAPGAAWAGLISSTGNGEHWARCISPTLSNAQHWQISCVASASATNWLALGDRGDSANKYAWFNLSTGALGSTSGTVLSSAITALGGGWYLCSLVISRTNTATLQAIMEPSSGNGSVSFAAGGEAILCTLLSVSGA